MGRKKSAGGDVKVFAEATLLTVGGGSLLLWGWAVGEVGGVVLTGLLVWSFLWQWFRRRDPERGASVGGLVLLALVAVGVLLLFLYGR